MTNATPAAGTPAADPYPRWETAGRLVRPARPAHARTRAPRVSGKGTDATAQLLRCFPRWTRALEQLTSRALERLAANEPVDPNDPDGWRSRDAHAQAILHRHGGEAQRHAPDLGSDRGTDRRPGAGRPRRRPRLGHGHPPRPARRAAGARARHAAGRPRGPGSGRIGSTSGACSPTARARRPPGRRPVALGARQPQPVRRRRPALLADRIGHLVGARRRAARPGRQRRPAGRRVRRAGEGARRVAADAGALARHDPADRRARRPARARPALRRRADRQPRRRCSSGSTSTRSTPGRRNAWTPRASSRRSSPASSDRRSARGCRATSATGGAGSPSAAAPTRAPAAPAAPSSSCGCSRSRRAGSASGGSGRRRARSSTRHPSAAMDLGEAVQTAVDARAAAAALDRGRRPAEGHRPGRADEGPAGDAHDHHLRRRVGHAPGGWSPSRRSASCARSSAPRRR